jgi:hypothetical protein
MFTLSMLLLGPLTVGIFGPAWWRGHDTREPPEPSPPKEPTVAEVAAELAADLKALVRRVNAAGGRLPVGAVPGVRAIEDRLRPLLAYLSTQTAGPDAVRRLSAMIRQYLPEAVDAYLALPARYATSEPSGGGTTPADDLLAQLARLQEAADQLQRDIYDKDAQALAIQRRFLDSKFRRSDLDL